MMLIDADADRCSGRCVLLPEIEAGQQQQLFCQERGGQASLAQARWGARTDESDKIIPLEGKKNRRSL